MKPKPQHSGNTSEAAIFARVFEGKSGRLSQNLARQLVRMDFSPEDRTRMHELAEKNQQGSITNIELEELDNFIKVGDMLAILQSIARKVIRDGRRM